MNTKPARVNNALFPPFIFYILVIVLIASCAVPVSKFVSKAYINTGIVPKDYDPKKHILLFAEMPRVNKPNERSDHATKKLAEALQEYCYYKYEIASLDDINSNNSKYRDTSVYKFAILNTLSSSWHGHTSTTIFTDPYAGRRVSSVSPTARSTSIDFGFYDRTLTVKYPNSGNAATSLKYTIAALMETIKRAKQKI